MWVIDRVLFIGFRYIYIVSCFCGVGKLCCRLFLNVVDVLSDK